jgi:hypothetical protein
MLTRAMLIYTAMVACLGCSKEKPIDIDTLIPQNLVKGSVPEFNTKATIIKDSSIKGGYSINGSATVPASITMDQIKPTAMGAIKGVKINYPDCESIIIRLLPSEKIDGNKAAIARGEYKDGSIYVWYAVAASDHPANHGKFKRISWTTKEFVLASPSMKADQRLYENFYKELIDRTSVFDSMYKPFISAMQHKEYLQAAIEAKKYKEDLSVSQANITSLSSPELTDKAAQDKLKSGKDLIDAAYMNKLNMISYYIDFITTVRLIWE